MPSEGRRRLPPSRRNAGLEDLPPFVFELNSYFTSDNDLQNNMLIILLVPRRQFYRNIYCLSVLFLFGDVYRCCCGKTT